MAERIQRRRTRGWRMPEGAIYVGRPTKWGNPFPFGPDKYYKTREDAVAAYRYAVKLGLREIPIWPEALSELRGHDLVCWCPLVDETGNRVPCHADVLLELANAPLSTD